MSILQTKNLCLSYNDRTIIDGITFSVSAGEAAAVIGRNGAGKSTLLKCLCGLLKPCGGSVLIGGVDIAAMSPRETALKIAYVPQGNNRIAPPFTVREYVMMARFPYRAFLSAPSKQDIERVSDALALTDTARFADRGMNTLSGGEFQAALIAGAVAQGTPFLLLDEPTAYLDPYHRENIRQLIERVYTQRGVAVITVTHDVNLALSVHDSILALVDGKVNFCGTKDEFCADAEEKLSQIFGVDFYAVKYPDTSDGIGNADDKKYYIAKGKGAK